MLHDSSQTIEIIHGEGEPTHAVIWLHGLGASSNDFPPVIPYLGLNQTPTIRFVFPQAPSRPITINGGMVMPGWYDIKGKDIADKEDLPGMTEAKDILENLIRQQMGLGIASDRILLAGFSQGGAVAYYTGIRFTLKLAGLLALSTYLPFWSDAIHQHSEVNTAIPILAMHGRHDQVVPMSLGKASTEVLKNLGYPIEWKTYPAEHTVMPEQLRHIGQWINRIFR